mmetsp:Transcript_3367/g.3768  ORF Transcript_3367/g.3768 Transcript_3367/m.3768 type:complete len:86 (+) Transcript_3367:102-359(+)
MFLSYVYYLYRSVVVSKNGITFYFSIMIFIHTVPEMSSMQQEDEIERALSSSSDEEWDETLETERATLLACNRSQSSCIFLLLHN